MSNSHTLSFTRQIAEGTFDNCYRSIGPVVFSTDGLRAAGLMGVKGTLTHNDSVLDLNERWVTITPAEVKALIEQGTKDNTVQSIRVVSKVAGSRYSAGSEDALLVSLTSKEGIKLAQQYGCVYSRTVKVGQAGIEVTHTNAIAITLAAANEAMGYLQFPGIEKEVRPSRADRSNPSIQDALAFYDATGNLPARVKTVTSSVDTDFASNFTVAPRGRTYNNRNSNRNDDL